MSGLVLGPVVEMASWLVAAALWLGFQIYAGLLKLLGSPSMVAVVLFAASALTIVFVLLALSAAVEAYRAGEGSL